jgi:hypothetical protein
MINVVLMKTAVLLLMKTPNTLSVIAFNNRKLQTLLQVKAL